MMNLKSLAALLLGAGAQASYEGHQVVRVVPETIDQLQKLRLLAESEVVDFWREPSKLGAPVDMRISPEDRSEMMEYLESTVGLKTALSIEDVQNHLDESINLGTKDDWDSAYHNLEDINAWMTQLVKDNSNITSMFELGQTYEGRTVYGMKITAAKAGSPQIYLDGGIHAREWIAPAVVQHIIGALVNGYATGDNAVKEMVNTAEWLIVPVYNADGYAFTWAADGDRMWRKNRQPNPNSPLGCIGTDACRNADAGFGGAGSSDNPCSDTYHGPEPFSVPIVKAWTNFVKGLDNLKGYVNFHSYADSWLTAYGYTADKPKDYERQEALGKAVTDAIKAVHGTTYNHGPAYTTIYPASGIPSDWLYDNQGVVYSQACELSGNSFSPPPKLIKPNGEEIFEGMKVLHGTILKEFNEQQ